MLSALRATCVGGGASKLSEKESGKFDLPADGFDGLQRFYSHIRGRSRA